MGFISCLFSWLCLRGAGCGDRALHGDILLSNAEGGGQHQLALKPQQSLQPVRPFKYVTHGGNSDQNKNQGCVWRGRKNIEKQKKNLEYNNRKKAEDDMLWLSNLVLC